MRPLLAVLTCHLRYEYLLFRWTNYFYNIGGPKIALRPMRIDTTKTRLRYFRARVKNNFLLVSLNYLIAQVILQPHELRHEPCKHPSDLVTKITKGFSYQNYEPGRLTAMIYKLLT